jgi:toxin ParE1/3/4
VAARYDVFLARSAEGDLETLHRWMTANRSPEVADALLDDLLRLIGTLENFPERGNIPKELESLGIAEFRQLLLGPYRIIYRIVGDSVIILLIADGRRDMQAILQQRVLRR